nr:uncharacterized protein LOC109184147 [Ipomoea trifida]
MRLHFGRPQSCWFKCNQKPTVTVIGSSQSFHFAFCPTAVQANEGNGGNEGEGNGGNEGEGNVGDEDSEGSDEGSDKGSDEASDEGDEGNEGDEDNDNSEFEHSGYSDFENDIGGVTQEDDAHINVDVQLGLWFRDGLWFTFPHLVYGLGMLLVYGLGMVYGLHFQ